MPTTKTTTSSQEPAKTPSTVPVKEKAIRRLPPAKPATRPVKARFKAGKDL